MTSHSLTSWRSFAVRFLIAIVVASVLTGGSFASAYWYANSRVADIPRVKGLDGIIDPTKPGEPANYLIVGSDTGSFIDTDAEKQAFDATGERVGQRADVIMIVHVDPGAKTGRVVSIPRDLEVDIPGHGHAKINSAYNDGPSTLLLTIAQNFDIPIHHYLEVDFASFQEIVDSIGRVHIYFPTPVRDLMTGLAVPLGGCAPLDGEQALAFARSRHLQQWVLDDSSDGGHWSYDRSSSNDEKGDPRADIGRIARQRYFLRTLAQAAISKTGRNPLTAIRLLDRVVPHLHADEGLDLHDLQHLIATFRNVDPAKIPMETMPFVEESGGLEVDSEQTAILLERLRTFTPPTTLPAATSPTDATPTGASANSAAGTATDAPTTSTSTPLFLDDPMPGLPEATTPSGAPLVGCPAGT